MAKEALRKSSSSGGMFTILADYVLEQGGLVCGAAFSADYMSVSHIVVSDTDSLARIRGSKYLQSSMEGCYKQLEEHLTNGGYVLFSGTPCQVAGFRSFLKKDYEKLFLVDIVCHGVPSPKVYRKYIQEIAEGRALKKVDFREKSFWGWGSATSAFFEDGSVYRNDCFRDEYWRAFLGGLSTRECCGSCEFASPVRIGDFSIGDFWGVGTLEPSCDDGLGTTLLLVNTEKAKALLNTLREHCALLKPMDYEQTKELAKTRNGRFLYPRQSHWGSERFFQLLDKKPFTVAFDQAVNNKYDVGVTGWWYNENYGGTLTYFALNTVLCKMGYTVLMIAKCSPNPEYKPNEKTVPYRFAKKHYNISKSYTPDTISTLSDHCNVFISGSDQLFNPTLWPWSGPQYFLNYVGNDKKIISYASSFGQEFYDDKNLKVPMGYWLRRFDALSVRESYAVDIFRDVFDLDAKHVMDPVFLCDVEEYEALANESGKTKEEDYFVSFFLDPDEKKRDAILWLNNKLGLPYVNLLNAMDFDRNMELLHLDNCKPNADLEEWLFYYKNSNFVITDSFHGTCFAIIFRKNFISLANTSRGTNRFISLLETAGLMDRLIYDPSEIESRPDLFEDIDYDRVFATLEPKIKESLDWLKNAIEQPKGKAASEFNSLSYELDRLSRERDRLNQESERLSREVVSLNKRLNETNWRVSTITPVALMKTFVKQVLRKIKSVFCRFKK